MSLERYEILLDAFLSLGAGGHAIGELLVPKNRCTASNLHEGKRKLINKKNLLSLHIISRISCLDQPSRILPRPSIPNTPPGNEYNLQLLRIDVQFQLIHESLDDR